MNLNPNILKLGGLVFVFGVALLLLTYVGAYLLPIIFVLVAGYIAYDLVKNWNK